MTIAWITSLLAPALIAWAAIEMLSRSRWARRLADHPNERSLHAVPTPRIGGLGIVLGVAPIALPHAVGLLGSGPLAVTLACAFALALISLVDDLRHLPVAVRLAAHGIAAAVVVATLGGVPTDAVSWLVAALATVAIMWATNLFNFMDGSDGLAGGMALLGFAAYAIAAALAGDRVLALVSAAIASASAGFLAHNFPPARAFLGDAGSIPLGFLAGALGLYGVSTGAWPLAFPILVFAPFVVDATVTLLLRALRGEKLWRAHRSHHYQRLVLAGWSRRRLALTAYALMAACAASALLLARAGFMLQCGIILAWAAAFALLLVSIHRQTTRMAESAQ